MNLIIISTILFLLAISLYIYKSPILYVQLVSLFYTDPNQDCLFTNWSECDQTGTQRRSIILNKQGSGDPCEPLVRSCRIKSTKNRWELCNSSDQCIGSDKFCRVGDMRCTTDTDCEWANYTDGTTRDCTKLK
jgi:hypothetical protein